jgi:hypothetical protein
MASYAGDHLLCQCNAGAPAFLVALGPPYISACIIETGVARIELDRLMIVGDSPAVVSHCRILVGSTRNIGSTGAGGTVGVAMTGNLPFR